MKQLFHITSPENYNSIMEKGLIPQIGPNSMIANENEKYVYLCNESDILSWRILLNRHIVLRVNITEEEYKLYAEEAVYSNYNEVLYSAPIPADRIHWVLHAVPPLVYNNYMTKLCINWLYIISKMTTSLAKYYNNMYYESATADFEDISGRMRVLIFVMHNLNFDIAPKYVIQSKLIEMGQEGLYTFVDTYNNTSKRMYEMLIEYPKDGLYEKRKELYDLILKKFDSETLSVNTGGWTT